MNCDYRNCFFQLHRQSEVVPCHGQSPNQSLEPTRVGKPPLAAQLQR